MKVAVAVVLIACAFAFGESTTKPSKASTPATKPTQVASTKPTTSATTSASKKYPTPAELIEKMKATKAKKDATPKVAFFDLATRLSEKPSDFSLWGGQDTQTLNNLLDRIRQAQDDKSVRAVLITFGDEAPTFPQAQELRDALLKLNKAGKQTFVYADSYDTAMYTMATGASHICMLEGGDLMLPGVGLETMFLKDLLDKVGVRADSIQIGEYKGADEEYTRSRPSEELRGELTKLTQAMYDEIVDGISLNRNISKENVRRAIDECIIRGTLAKERGLVDHLLDQDGLRNLIKTELNEKEMDVVADYGREPRETPDFSNPFALFASMAKRPAPSEKPGVALVYADGMIVDGEGGEGMFGSAVGAQDFRRALRSATRDDTIKAVVIRIDSPGGSALASEVMWQAARRAAAKKPVIISIGGMAASGGYYLASAGDHIFADPSAIVGSIGVVGGKFVYKDLMEKLGVHTESFSKGRNADLFSSQNPFDERQKKMITSWMRQTYDQFTERVMSGRKDKIKDIDKVARGRIFLARQAKDLGMVDEIGGTSDALAYAAKKVNLKEGDYELRILPAPRTLADYFGYNGPQAAATLAPKVTISPDSVLKLMSPQLNRLMARQIQTLQLLQDHPVLLVMPAAIDMK
ncbi:MAG TPA: signal peptide peptidase SppA [Tepidisphaeraceae bacterium]|jgi:protease-4